MALPKFNEMYIPSLQILADRGEDVSTQNMRLLLKEYYSLSDEEYAESSSKGNNIFYGRVSWCLSDLFRSGLLEKPKQGIYRISDLGREKLSLPRSIEQYVLDTVRNLDAQKSHKNKEKNKIIISKALKDDNNTPADIIDQAYQEIKDMRKQEVLSIILQKKPGEFERLTLVLLKAMGYGGSIEGAHKQTKLSNDGGIDGIIKEDVLGLGHIYIQAKRYALDINVGKPAIQQFVGAISAAQSNKGIFITTSDFTQEAYQYVNKLTDKNIALINGDQLAEYIYEYGLGMQSESVYEIKKLDQDFWANYLDEDK
ncbi:MAG: restriction endonuclease [Porphyromonadaceae bacterium]|nr:restriction endonuclease [Porphyromonadaceae bacterium]